MKIRFALLASVICCFSLVLVQPAKGQDDLMNLLDSTTTQKKVTNYTYATFKTTHLITGESVEIPAPGVLQFDIAHRFGTFKDGWRGLFGLDQANIRFAFDYGITPYLAIGFGRSSADKMYDFSVKAKLLRQSTGYHKYPLTIDFYASAAVTSYDWPDKTRKNYFSSRLSYAFQLLIARKFGHGFSMQISPTLVHRNLVPTSSEHNDVFSIGIGGRQMVSRSVSVNMEYYFLVPGQIPGKYYGMGSVGIDLETGGHVFQFMITNGRGMVPEYFVGNTDQGWRHGDIRLGFNINRVFTLYNYEKMQQKKAARKQQKLEKSKAS